MKRVLTLATFFTLLTLSPATAVPSTFTIKGSGYGHGVGLSQIGAKGQALEGKSAAQILSYYFPSAQLTPVDDSANIRVNVGHQLTTIKVSGSFRLYAGETESVYQNVTKAQTFAIVGNQIGAGDFGAADSWTIRWNEGTSISVPGVNMHYGYLQIKPVYAKGLGLLIEATNTLSLHDQYMWGVSEVPSYWPSAALQAQVIASRTYALSRMGSIRKECDCNIYSSKYDQVYIGYSKESEPKYGSLWTAAVAATDTDATHALALTYNGAPINVYFFSSSGGATQLSKDVWGTAYPYLVSVPDPWSLDPVLNPGYANWSRTVKQADMAAAFGLPNVARYVVTGRTQTGSALAVTAYSSAGVKVKISVSDFKTKLKLPSSGFDLPASVVVPLPTPAPTDTSTTP